MKTAIGILMVLLVGTSFAEVLSGSAYPQDAYALYASLYDDYECNSAVKIFYDSFYDAHSILVCYPGNTVGYSSMESLFNYEPTSEPALLIIVTVRAVADFYLGSGTTAEVCKDLNRNFIGCDIDSRAVEIGKNRCI